MRRLVSILRKCRSLSWVVAFAFATLASGCKQFDVLRGDGYTGADAEWGKKYRPTGPKGEAYFGDEKGAQIERSLGL